jgi:hypothetical protein
MYISTVENPGKDWRNILRLLPLLVEMIYSLNIGDPDLE